MGRNDIGRLKSKLHREFDSSFQYRSSRCRSFGDRIKLISLDDSEIVSLSVCHLKIVCQQRRGCGDDDAIDPSISDDAQVPGGMSPSM